MSDSTPPTYTQTSHISLSPTEEVALRLHLDEQINGLERDERKHALGSLATLLTRLQPLLHRILELPASEPWQSTRVEYLLHYTANMVRYIVSLPLMTLPADGGDDDEVEEEAGDIMRALLDLMQEVERGWLVVLSGNGWVQGKEVVVDGGGRVDLTARVRLRSIIENARAKFLAWARPYGEFGGEVMGPDGDEGEILPTEGWESEVVNMWSRILRALDSEVADS